jgi:hypothetical protein
MQDQGDDHDRALADDDEEPIPDLLWDLMEKCWEDDSYARPSAEDVLVLLESVAVGGGLGGESHQLPFNRNGGPSSAASKWTFTRERRGSADSEMMAVDYLSSSSVAGSAGGSDESEWMPLPEFGSTLGGPSSRPTSRQRPYTAPSPYSSGYAFTGAPGMGYTRGGSPSEIGGMAPIPESSSASNSPVDAMSLASGSRPGTGAGAGMGSRPATSTGLGAGLLGMGMMGSKSRPSSSHGRGGSGWTPGHPTRAMARSASYAEDVYGYGYGDAYVYGAGQNPPGSSDGFPGGAHTGDPYLENPGHDQDGRPTTASALLTGGTSFQCSQCGMQFGRRVNFERHLRRHLETRRYTCHCGKKFFRIDNLYRHAGQEHGEDTSSLSLSLADPAQLLEQQSLSNDNSSANEDVTPSSGSSVLGPPPFSLRRRQTISGAAGAGVGSGGYAGPRRPNTRNPAYRPTTSAVASGSSTLGFGEAVEGISGRPRRDSYERDDDEAYPGGDGAFGLDVDVVLPPVKAFVPSAGGAPDSRPSSSDYRPAPIARPLTASKHRSNSGRPGTAPASSLMSSTRMAPYPYPVSSGSSHGLPVPALQVKKDSPLLRYSKRSSLGLSIGMSLALGGRGLQSSGSVNGRGGIELERPTTAVGPGVPLDGADDQMDMMRLEGEDGTVDVYPLSVIDSLPQHHQYHHHQHQEASMLDSPFQMDVPLTGEDGGLDEDEEGMFAHHVPPSNLDPEMPPILQHVSMSGGAEEWENPFAFEVPRSPLAATGEYSYRLPGQSQASSNPVSPAWNQDTFTSAVSWPGQDLHYTSSSPPSQQQFAYSHSLSPTPSPGHGGYKPLAPAPGSRPGSGRLSVMDLCNPLPQPGAGGVGPRTDERPGSSGLSGGFGELSLMDEG